MARFVVLDHSLTGMGGHHYEQAVQILQAADRLDLRPVLAANTRFTQRDLLPPHWQVLAVFAEESFDCLADYPLDTRGLPLSAPQPATRVRSLWSWPGNRFAIVRQRWETYRRRRRIERFAAACTAIHAQIGLQRDDHVFIPTTSLFDLLGLVRFLQQTHDVAEVMWHGLFHYGFLQGREPQYAGQQVVERKVRRQLEYLLEHVPPGRLRLYGTTQKLAEQYNRLSLTEFGVLPFPVDAQALQSVVRPLPSRRLRLTCAGFLRREKGKGLASRFVQDLWGRELATGHMQLVVQTNRRQALRMLPRDAMVALNFKSALAETDPAPIVWLRHPLTREAYIDVIRQSDIAVFLHEDRAYYTRCSGVLVEMLAGGVPVLVPAGSWLADQVSESIYAHLDRLRANAVMVGRWTVDQVTWNSRCQTVDGHGLSPCGTAPYGAECDLEVPAGTCAILVSCQWNTQTRPGTYLRLTVEAGAQPADDEKRPVVTILGPRPLHAPVSALMPLDDGVPRVKLRLSNAYDESPLSVSRLDIGFLGVPAEGKRTYATGCVGLVFSDIGQLPRLVREMREHYPHYLASAQTFAANWRHEHDTQRIVERLLACGGSPCRAAA
ncbi:MAG: hypothetical protein ACYC0X_29770 [Pirellulaceae bacterium]